MKQARFLHHLRHVSITSVRNNQPALGCQDFISQQPQSEKRRFRHRKLLLTGKAGERIIFIASTGGKRRVAEVGAEHRRRRRVRVLRLRSRRPAPLTANNHLRGSELFQTAERVHLHDAPAPQRGTRGARLRRPEVHVRTRA